MAWSSASIASMSVLRGAAERRYTPGPPAIGIAFLVRSRTLTPWLRWATGVVALARRPFKPTRYTRHYKNPNRRRYRAMSCQKFRRSVSKEHNSVHGLSGRIGPLSELVVMRDHGVIVAICMVSRLAVNERFRLVEVGH